MTDACLPGGSSAVAPGVAVVTLGCKVNQAESDELRATLAEGGCDIGSEESAAIVVNSCCVTSDAERKVRKAVRRALAAPGSPRVVVTGCLATIDPDGLADLDGRVVVEPDKERVAGRVDDILEGYTASEPVSRQPQERTRTRVAVKIQDGCDTGCTYCIVPTARGAPRSVPAHEVVERVSYLAADGTVEVVLTGVNVGRYDSEGVGLPELLRRVDDTGVTRWRLTSIEPIRVTDGLAEALSAAAHMCPHVHVPLQSGSDRVLSAMSRGYTASAYERAVARLREAVPGLVVTTDVMVGFPGESDDDLSRTVELCERVGFAKLHVFRFSARPSTAAADMSGALSPQVKAARSERLQQLGDRLRDDYMLSRVGRRADVLVERVDGMRAEGTTEDYLKVEMSSEGLRVGTLHQVTLGVPAAGRMSAAC